MHRLSTLLLAATVLAACGDDQDPAGAATLWDDLQAADYRSWDRAPGYETRRQSSAPHGDQVEIFVNDVVAGALAGGPIDAWPEGSLIVKDGYTDDGELELVAAMEKRADGWYYAEWDGEGESIFSGRPSVCTDCHASGSDMVRAFSLPE